MQSINTKEGILVRQLQTVTIVKGKSKRCILNSKLTSMELILSMGTRLKEIFPILNRQTVQIEQLLKWQMLKASGLYSSVLFILIFQDRHDRGA